ncbi:MAG: O-antigen ligase family protein [Lysobacterales bacterium]
MLFTLGYLIMVLIRPQEFVPALQGVPVMPILLLMSTLVWAMSRKNFDSPQFALVVMFLLATAFSRLASGWVSGTFDWIVEFAPTCLVFYLVAGSINSQGRLKLFMATIALCAATMAAHGIDQVQSGVGWTGAQMIQGRITYLGVFNDPNDLGLFFVVALPMVLNLMKTTRSIVMRLLWLCCLGLILYGVLLTDSRGTLLATMLVFGMLLMRWKGPLVAGVLAAPVLAAALMGQSRLQELDSSEDSAAGRVDAWYEGIQMFKSNPLFGVGAGRFTEYHHLTAHNSFVLVLAESGMLGFSIFLAMIGYSLLMTFRLSKVTLEDVRARPPPKASAAEQTIAQPRYGKRKVGSEDGKISKDDLNYLKGLGYTFYLSILGFCCSAFFLSRAYTVVLYVLFGMVVALYLIARRKGVQLPRFGLFSDAFAWGVASIVAAFGLFVIVRILLITSS